MIKRALTASAVLAAIVTLGAGPASALNVTKGGGAVRRCVHWINTTDDGGWPIEYCVAWR